MSHKLATATRSLQSLTHFPHPTPPQKWISFHTVKSFYQQRTLFPNGLLSTFELEHNWWNNILLFHFQLENTWIYDPVNNVPVKMVQIDEGNQHWGLYTHTKMRPARVLNSFIHKCQIKSCKISYTLTTDDGINIRLIVQVHQSMTLN